MYIKKKNMENVGVSNESIFLNFKNYDEWNKECQKFFLLIMPSSGGKCGYVFK